MTAEHLVVRADGCVLHGQSRRGVAGIFIKEDGFQGWEGLPASRRDALARAVAHGEHDVPTYLPARIVTVDAWLVAETDAEFQNLKDRVAGLGATGERFTLTVELRGRSLYSPARRVAAEVTDLGVDRSQWRVGEAQIQLVCADPRKYGHNATFPENGSETSIPVHHFGNFPAFPVIEVPNAPSNYTVSSPGGTFTVTGATSGGTHRIDMRSGRVARDGAPMLGVGRGDVWAVPVGTTWNHTLSAPGRVLIPDTFI